MLPLLCRLQRLAAARRSIEVRWDTLAAMPQALIIGGTGQIGRATAGRLLAAGWHVDLAGRNPAHMPAEIASAGGRFVAADRDDSEQLLGALGDGADLLVDCICYTADAATRLLPLVRNAGSTVMISSKAVYVDDSGRHSNSEDAPRFDGPIDEERRPWPPGRATTTRPRATARTRSRPRTSCSTAASPSPSSGPRRSTVSARTRRANGSSSSACSTGAPQSSSLTEAQASTIRPPPRTSLRSSKSSRRNRAGGS